MALGITVAICTYNGAALLPETIRHLALQRVRPEVAWEIIIVNNASTDNTTEVALLEWEKYKTQVPFSIRNQPKQGLTFARELAIEKAKFEFVLFCDDDNWLSPDYVNLAYDLMREKPRIGVLGGRGELIFESTPPKWLYHLSVLAHGAQAPASGKVDNNAVYGAGCVMRKTALKMLMRAGFSSDLTDRNGACLSAGGDYELCYAIALLGYDIWYEEKLHFRHFTPSKRISREYCERLIKASPASFNVLIPYRIRLNLGCKNSSLFPVYFVRHFISYCKKLFFALYEKATLGSDPDDKIYNKLMLLSIKAKLQSFRNYKAMQENFLKIKALESAVFQAGTTTELVSREASGSLPLDSVTVL